MKIKVRIGKLSILLLGLCLSYVGFSQSPQGISYQAVIRDGSGIPIVNKNIGIKITLENISGVSYYTETQTTTTSAQGVIAVTIGKGSVVGSNTFASIPWKNGDIYVKIEIDPNGGSTYSLIGTHTQLQSVPFAMYAESTKKEVVSDPTALDTDPIFEVKNKLGQVVFGVYQSGVRVYVEDTPGKGTKGGFAVGGLSGQSKVLPVEYFRITPDSARIFVNEVPSVKGTKGGFAVGGLSGQSKAITSRNLMFVALDSTRIYIDSSKTIKGTKGGFAVGGLSGQSKGSNYDLLRVTSDSTRIFVNDKTTKGTKGGFAVGGLSGQSKTPSTKYLDLTPNNYFIGHKAGSANLTGLYNSFIGYNAGMVNQSGNQNIFIGYQAGSSNIVGSWNTFMGFEAGLSNVGSDNTFIGYKAGRAHQSKGGNVYIGSKSGELAQNGEQNVFIGESSGKNVNTAAKNVFIGFEAGFTTSDGSSNVFIGNVSGRMNQTGASNVFLGDSAGYSSTNSYNVFLGKGSGKSSTGQYNAFMGHQAGLRNTSGFNNVFIGNKSGFYNTTGDNNVFLGFETGLKSNSSFNSFIGYQAGRNFSTGKYNTFIGYQSGFASISAGTGNNNVALGYKSGSNLTNGRDNVFIGTQAGDSTSTGYENTFIGYQAGKNNTTGWQNIAIGWSAGKSLTTNDRNTLIGRSSGESLSTGIANAFFGTFSGRLTTSGSNNTIIGYDAGYQCYTGSYNTFVGFQAGRGFGATAIGDSSVFIGNEAGSNEGASNKLYISNSNTSSPLIWGDFKTKEMALNATSVRIGTTLNYATLNVEKWDGLVAMYNRRSTDGQIIQFRKDNVEVGSISLASGVVSYNAFTGSHYGVTNEKIDEGELVVMNGNNSWLNNKKGAEVLYGISESSRANDPSVMGAYFGILETNKPYGNDNPHLIMAEGNGEMWVIDNGENLQPGDFLISSNIKGHAMKDKGEFPETYIVAKVAEPINWLNITESIKGTKHAKISVIFTSFIRNNKSIKQQEEIDALKAELEAIKAMLKK